MVCTIEMYYYEGINIPLIQGIIRNNCKFIYPYMSSDLGQTFIVGSESLWNVETGV